MMSRPSSLEGTRLSLFVWAASQCSQRGSALREPTYRGEHHAGRLKRHVDGVWLPVAAKEPGSVEAHNVRDGPPLGEGRGVREGRVSQVQQVLQQEAVLHGNFQLKLRVELKNARVTFRNCGSQSARKTRHNCQGSLLYCCIKVAACTTQKRRQQRRGLGPRLRLLSILQRELQRSP